MKWKWDEYKRNKMKFEEIRWNETKLNGVAVIVVNTI